MEKLTVFDEMNYPNRFGTSLKGYIELTYDQLVDKLGKPTINEPSGDEKVQVEWIVEFKDKYGEENIFTIYDWKTYDKEFTINKLKQFHIGGNSYAGHLSSYLESL